MRICYITTGTFSHIGPYLEHFRDAGHDVHFICLSPSPPRDVPTYNLGIGKTYSQTRGKWKYPISMIRAKRLINEIKPDIIHAHYATSGGLAALLTGFHPAVLTVHGSDLINGAKSVIWRPFLKKIFRYADCINVVSQELEDIAVSFGINKEKIEVFSPGIDTNKFAFSEKPQFTRTSVLKLICTRRIESVFDHPTILNALVILKEKGIQFRMTFAGDGSLLDEMKKYADNPGFGDSVNFLGRVPNDKLPELLSQNDIYLSASKWDGTSLSLLEAMACGLFPIVSDITSNSAWIKDGYNGFLHKVENSSDLANCILRLYDSPDIIQKAAQYNRQKVCEKADRNTNMKRLELVYRRLTNK